MLAALAQSPVAQELPGGEVPQAFAAKLAALAAGYDLVLLVCSTGNPVLQVMALAATRYLLIPTKTDAAGWDGLRMVGPRVKKARRNNPRLTFLGGVLFAHQTNATRVVMSHCTASAAITKLIRPTSIASSAQPTLAPTTSRRCAEVSGSPSSRSARVGAARTPGTIGHS